MKKVVIIDDMQSARNVLKRLLDEFVFIEVVGSFRNPNEALEFIKNNTVDLVFVDIEMPLINGIEFSKKLEELDKYPYFIFATAYLEYSLKAWSTKAIGYITKPYDKKELNMVIEKFLSFSPLTQDISVKCFPNFNIFINNEAIKFSSKKSKEILAYLVFNEGGWVNINEICANVLESLEEAKAKDSLRSYVSRLKKTLESYGVDNLIEQGYGKYRIVSTEFTCDYYEYLEGNKDLFMGEFLKSYSWAEPTLAVMQTSINSL